jgi:predicted amidohydrolase
MTRLVSIAACNFYYREVPDFDGFAAHARGLLDQAEGADIVVFPELFTLELFTTFGEWQTLPPSEYTRIDEYTGAYRDLFESEAKKRHQYIAAGSHLIKENGQYFNSAHLFGPDGSLVTHAKTHIFPIESDWETQEGDTIDVVELPFAKVGFNICYEAEIPECSATLTEQGAEIILCPSFTMTEWGFWRVRHCAQSRCIENQIYFVHCCLGGELPAPLVSGWARSSILSPCDAPWPFDGIVAQAELGREMVVRGEVDLDLLYTNRETGAAPTFRDRRRRQELYTKWPSHISRDS